MLFIKSSAAVVILIVLTSIVSAQESDKRFFEKDYAKSPLEEATNKTKPTPTFSPKSGSGEKKIDGRNAINDQEWIYHEQDPIPVSSIEAYIYGEPKDHLREGFQQILEALKKNKAPVTKIHAVGGIGHFIKFQETFDLAEAGVEIALKGEVPDEYNVIYSPVWVLFTEKGRIVLEAVGPLSTFLTAKGELIPPRSLSLKKLDLEEDRKENSEKELENKK